MERKQDSLRGELTALEAQVSDRRQMLAQLQQEARQLREQVVEEQP
jgi:hypothetical protein